MFMKKIYIHTFDIYIIERSSEAGKTKQSGLEHKNMNPSNREIPRCFV